MEGRCRYCKGVVRGHKHYCPKRRTTFYEDDGDDGFLISMAIGAATNSTLLGGLLGGNFAGALAGDALDGEIFDSSEQSSDSYDSGSGDYDSGGDYGSGSGGFD